MTISAYSSAIVDAMLGWLKGLANWVLRLFNLAGSAGTSPLLWLSEHWLGLLLLLAGIGVAGDILVWLVRWRPHWVWFRKERVIVDDEHFFNDYSFRDELDSDEDAYLEKNWQEQDYVVASTLAGRRRTYGGSLKKGEGAGANRRDGRSRGQSGKSFQRGERRRPRISAEPDRLTTRRQVQSPEQPEPYVARKTDIFGDGVPRSGVTDLYEDEVFNVNNLPRTGEYAREEAADAGSKDGDLEA